MNRAESKYFRTAARMDEALIECLEKKDFEYITVKELCEKAGVNRSTFYLHYENIADLLGECIEYTNRKCFERYDTDLADVESRLRTGQPEELILLSPQYLWPYLEFVRENRRLYRVVLSHQALFRTQGTFSRLFDRVFSPIMDRFHYPEGERAYIVRFYLGGLTAVVGQWLERDCADPIEQIIGICMRCIMPGGEEKG